MALLRLAPALAALAFVTTGCQGDDGSSQGGDTTEATGDPEPAPEEETPPGDHPLPPAGLHLDGSDLTLQTDSFTLEPGQEKYVCWTVRASDAVQVATFAKRAQPFVHHMLLVTTPGDEPEGMRECDGTFKLTWRPLFAAGAGEVELAFPENVVKPIDKDAQLMLQLHLLNASEKTITDSAAIEMSLSDADSPELVTFGAFGNTDIALEPGQPGQVVADCANPIGTRVVGYFPHMHMLGRSMSLEVGPSPEDMQLVYERAPYDFNEQAIDPTDMMLGGNSRVRVTCNYDNTTGESVTYGESTHDEMCWLIVFTVGTPTGCALGSAPLFG